MEIDHAKHREVGKGTKEAHVHMHIAIGKKLRTQTNLTYN